MYDVAIIGGGAAGLVAAIAAKRADSGSSVVIIERLDRVGKKIAVTGNGRCNICNLQLDKSHYYGKDTDFVAKVFNKFGKDDIISFFDSIGVPIIAEENRLFPRSLQAGSVVDALRFECDESGITTLCNKTVTDIKKKTSSYEILTDSGTFCAEKVILASGGLAGGIKLGCDKTVFSIASKLGIGSAKLLPAIVQLKCENSVSKQLKGIKVNAKVKLKQGERLIKDDFGEVLFCDYGLSGPPIMQLSTHAKEGYTVSLDLMPDECRNTVCRMLNERAFRFGQRPLSEFLTGMINKRLGQVVIKLCGLSLSEQVCTLRAIDITNIAQMLKCFDFKVVGNCGFSNAQATLGGILTDNFSPDSMECKKHKGLFAAGELLDVCGDCGGYNLSFAFASGFIAGKNSVK